VTVETAGRGGGERGGGWAPHRYRRRGHGRLVPASGYSERRSAVEGGEFWGGTEQWGTDTWDPAHRAVYGYGQARASKPSTELVVKSSATWPIPER
jgi:hypothetical protein